MAFESDFLELCVHSITRNAFASLNAYGAPTYSTQSSTFAARVVYENTLVRAFDGTQSVARTHVTVATTAIWNPKDKVTLPDGTYPPMISMNIIPDENGAHHIKMYF